VRLVLAENFERIHRANLIGMGIVPITFLSGEDADGLGLTGFERFDVSGLHAALDTGSPVSITAHGPQGARTFKGRLDLASAHEAALLRSGGLFATLLDGLKSEERRHAG
jgi:aconitate hydratase